MEVCHEKAHIKEMCHGNCEYVAEVNKELAEKDAEIAALKETFSRTEEGSGGVKPSTQARNTSNATEPSILVLAHVQADVESQPVCRGKVPPVDPFTGETLESRLDDWLPTLQ